LIVVQSTHEDPPLPQAVSSTPMVQIPFESQHPVHVAEQLGAPASGGRQIMTGSVGACGIGPHVSPRAEHSAADPQSWIGPIAVEGH
jgi:hypothetical protein